MLTIYSTLKMIFLWWLKKVCIQVKDKETEESKGEKRFRKMEACLWPLCCGSLSDAKAVSGNAFICPYFSLPSLRISHPSAAFIFVILSVFFLPRDLYHREICSTVHLAHFKRLSGSQRKKMTNKCNLFVYFIN